jgi:Gas vesicle protein K
MTSRPAMPVAAHDDEVPADASPDLEALQQAVQALSRAIPQRINSDPERAEQGLARLVLALIEVIRKVLEHQAVRRMDGGQLTPDEVERLGMALLRLNDKMGELKTMFGLTDKDLEIDLGPLGTLA